MGARFPTVRSPVLNRSAYSRVVIMTWSRSFCAEVASPGESECGSPWWRRRVSIRICPLASTETGGDTGIGEMNEQSLGFGDDRRAVFSGIVVVVERHAHLAIVAATQAYDRHDDARTPGHDDDVEQQADEAIEGPGLFTRDKKLTHVGMNPNFASSFVHEKQG